MAFVQLLLTGDATTEIQAADPLALAGDVTIVGSGKGLTVSDLSFGADSELTIATGDVTITGTYHSIVGQGDASDQLDGMSAGNDGQLLIIRPREDDEDITVVDNQNATLGNNIFLTNAATNVMDNDDDFMMFVYDAGADAANGAWLEISRSTGAVAVLTANAPANVGTVAAVGSGTEAAKDDHVHDTATGFIDNNDKFVAAIIENSALADNAVDSAEINTNAVGNDAIDNTANDIAFNQIIFTPNSNGTGTTVGTVYYDTEDNKLYVFTA